MVFSDFGLVVERKNTFLLFQDTALVNVCYSSQRTPMLSAVGEHSGKSVEQEAQCVDSNPGSAF